MSKTPEQRILELEQQVELLEKQMNRAECLADRADKKAIIFDIMIDYGEKESNIPIRKKQDPKQYNIFQENTNKALLLPVIYLGFIDRCIIEI
jgi:hypothetical protein